LAWLCAPHTLAGFNWWVPGKGKEERERKEGRREGGWTPSIFETWLRPCRQHFKIRISVKNIRLPVDFG